MEYFNQVLERQVNLPASKLTRNLDRNLEILAKGRYENRCLGRDGYIKPGSIRLVEKSMGCYYGYHFVGDITYKIRFKCKVAYPIVDKKMICMFIKRDDKLGLIGKMGPFRVLVPLETQKKHAPEFIELFENLQPNDFIQVQVDHFRTITTGIDKHYMITGHLVGSVEDYRNLTVLTNLNHESVLESETNFKTIETRDTHPSEWWKIDEKLVDLEHFEYLQNLKRQVFNLNQQYMRQMAKAGRKVNRDIWDSIRWFVNPYELLDNRNYVDGGRTSMHQDLSISRAYFKMWEIMANYNARLFGEIPRKMNFLHLAEAPGGFIQALTKWRDYKNLDNDDPRMGDRYWGLSLAPEAIEDIVDDTNTDVTTTTIKKVDKYPAWSKLVKQGTKYLDSNVKVRGPAEHRQKGDLKTAEGIIPLNLFYPGSKGDITDPETMRLILEKYKSEDMKADIITADAARDKGEDYEFQEMLMARLLYSETILALGCQCEGGSYILKVFDTFGSITGQLIQFLTCVYSDVDLYKPKTSRPTNSEKYIICSGYQPISDRLLETLVQKMNKWNEIEGGPESQVPTLSLKKAYLENFFATGIESGFASTLLNYNNTYIRIESNAIMEGLRLYRSGILFDRKDQIELKQSQYHQVDKWATTDPINLPVKDIRNTIMFTQLPKVKDIKQVLQIV